MAESDDSSVEPQQKQQQQQQVQQQPAKKTKFELGANWKRINIELFKIYKELYGDLKISQKFVIPATDEWPKAHHGEKLGKVVYDIRSSLKKTESKFNEEDINELLNLGFVVDAYEEKENRVLLAFETYKYKYGDCKIISTFKIPEDDYTWPEEVRGMNLGRIYSHIKKEKYYERIHADLLALGADLDVKKNNTFESVYAALVAFKDIHGDLAVPHKFIVPHYSADYPEVAWGMKLGTVVERIRHSQAFKEHKTELRALGLQINK